jgi:hypothetical protein
MKEWKYYSTFILNFGVSGQQYSSPALPGETAPHYLSKRTLNEPLNWSEFFGGEKKTPRLWQESKHDSSDVQSITYALYNNNNNNSYYCYYVDINWQRAFCH